jgi:hypothetical protein
LYDLLKVIQLLIVVADRLYFFALFQNRSQVSLCLERFPTLQPPSFVHRFREIFFIRFGVLKLFDGLKIEIGALVGQFESWEAESLLCHLCE